MTLDELNKLVDLEIQWLRYYAREDSRLLLNENSNIYTDLVSIGYTKRVVPLHLRCVPCVLTAIDGINEDMDLSKLQKLASIKNDNNLSPLEAYIKIYPEQKLQILNRLK